MVRIMSDWQPLSVRRGIKAIPSMEEGIPPTLNTSLEHWLREAWWNAISRDMSHLELLLNVAISTGIQVNTMDREYVQAAIIDACVRNSDVFLDVLDATLVETQGNNGQALAQILARGKSVWTVSSDEKSLVQRVDPTATGAAVLASTPSDDAANELREAWDKAYGRQTDASDAWDHSIKAVEALYIPLTVGKKEKANLGSAAGELKANASNWKFVLGDIRTVEGMMRFIWPNPDRHAGADRKVPTDEEARAVVHTAVTLVQWARDGLITKRAKQ
jgi:hypothetical protein